MCARPEPRPERRVDHSRYELFDLLATMVAVVQPDGKLLFVYDRITGDEHDHQTSKKT